VTNAKHFSDDYNGFSETALAARGGVHALNGLSVWLVAAAVEGTLKCSLLKRAACGDALLCCVWKIAADGDGGRQREMVERMQLCFLCGSVRKFSLNLSGGSNKTGRMIVAALPAWHLGGGEGASAVSA